MDEEQELTQITVPETISEVRADKVLASVFEDLSRSQIQKIFQEKNVFLNGTPITKKHLVSSGDELELLLPALALSNLQPYEMPLDVVYEDEDIIAINKPSGVVVHPGSGTGPNTLVHALLHHCGEHLSRLGGDLRPGVVHRLDKETSGIMLFAKSDKAYLRLIEAFSKRTIKKEYLAITRGVHRLLGGSIKEPIDRHPTHRIKMAVRPKGKGRDAHTDWSLQERFGDRFSLIRCLLHTGRTHQIRVHLSHMDLPLLGDRLYGFKPREGDPVLPERVMLHAHRLELEHPIKNTALKLEAPLPADFEALLSELRKHFIS